MGTKLSLPVRIMSSAWMHGVCLGLTLGAVSGCNGDDPVPQAIIDALPAEDPGGPSATHRAGQPCLQCHSAYGEALPTLAIGGTIFKEDPMGKLVGAAGVRVVVFDSSGGASRRPCTNSAGNFYIEAADWDTITFPLKSTVGRKSEAEPDFPSRRMESIIGREGSCANCHKLPSADRPGTGAGHDTPGVIIVEDGEESPDVCQVVQ